MCKKTDPSQRTLPVDLFITHTPDEIFIVLPLTVVSINCLQRREDVRSSTPDRYNVINEETEAQTGKALQFDSSIYFVLFIGWL